MSHNERGGLRIKSWKALAGVLLTAIVTVVLFRAITMPAQVHAQSAPPITHPIAGRENCTMCHNGTIAPFPADHAGRTNDTCLMCHTVAEATTTGSPTPVPTVAPTPTAQTSEPTATPGTGITPTPTQTPSTPTPVPTTTPTPSAPEVAECLMCHGSNSKLTKTFPNGETISLAIQQEQWHNSVHGSILVCTDCHQGYSLPPHPQVTANSPREFSVAEYEVCKTCHFANYTKTLDSIHYQALNSGNINAPVCTDCHGSHYIQNPTTEAFALQIPQLCGKCHSDVYTQYASSVHGQALINDHNLDVPTCTYCHGVHNIQNPTTENFRLEIPQLCGSCHSNATLMARYGLSSAVLTTYLNDFHGTTAQLVKEEGGTSAAFVAVCTDCHGIHDIIAVNSSNSPVIKANLLTTCQQCHANASANFPAAWLSHYEPSMSHAPLVYLIKLGYRILIPFLVIGLAIQVLVNLWRSAINR